MKIYISNHEDLISFHFFERLYRKRHPTDWVLFDEMDWLDKAIDRLQRGCQFIVNWTINPVLERYPLPTEYIKVNHHDLYNLDITLAKVIHASLVEFRGNYNGVPGIDMTQDVQRVIELSEQVGSLHDEVVKDPEVDAENDYALKERHWEILLDEMIWSYKQVIIGEWEWNANYLTSDGSYDIKSLDLHRQRMLNGMMLFVRYYCSLWK